MSTNYFKRVNGTEYSSTGTGLDQLVDTLSTDLGLRGHISSQDLQGGIEAANKMSQIIITAIEATGAAADGTFSEDEVRAINAYIRANHLDAWAALHGDDEGREETGYHLIQNDGASEGYRGENLANTVADGIYHLGFEIQGGNFLNEDGDANATVAQMTEWLNQFYTDHSTTATGLDRMTDMVMADKGLDRCVEDADISAGADAANGMNAIIQKAITEQGLAADGNISVEDVAAINSYIQTKHADEWIQLHGDDENSEETGFHRVQNDGATTRMFGENFVDTVADGIYHLGFDIKDGRLLNEDGDENATVADVADWLNYFFVDQGNTGTGLDELVQVIKSDAGLARDTEAGDINGGAAAADEMNKILVEAIDNTGVASDQILSVEDVQALNAYIRENHLERWTALHGDDENGEETGFHLVQNDGATERYRGDNFVNTVIDGIYHLGFEIKGDYVLNEDGERNANLGDLATWLNNFYLGAENTFGSEGSDKIHGQNVDEKIYGRDGHDKIYADGGNDYVEGGEGHDKLHGGDGDDTLVGGEGYNHLFGQDGNDTLISGSMSDKLYGGIGDDELNAGAGDDTLNGGEGNDALVAGDGHDQLYGANGDDSLNGGAGHDKLHGGDGADTLLGGDGHDRLSGGNGADRISGGADNDHLWGHSDNDIMFGDAGHDRLYGDDGNDTLVDGEGNDMLFGGNGDDLFYAVSDASDDRFWGQGGNDSFNFLLAEGGIGNDEIRGFEATDQLAFSDAAVQYSIETIDSYRSVIHLGTTADADKLGTITIYGQFTEANIASANPDMAAELINLGIAEIA